MSGFSRATMCFMIGASIMSTGCGGNGNSYGGGGGGPTAPPAGPGTKTIQMTAAANFSPANLTVSVGDTVRWFNPSNLTHTTTSGTCAPCTPNGQWNSGNMGNGAQFRVVFGPGTNSPGVVHIDATGNFPYYCIPHGAGMTGMITVNP